MKIACGEGTKVKEAALVGRPLRSNDERADVGDVLLIGMHMTASHTPNQ